MTVSISPERGLSIPKDHIQGAGCGDNTLIQIRDGAVSADVLTTRQLQNSIITDGVIPIQAWNTIGIYYRIIDDTNITLLKFQFEFSDLAKSVWYRMLIIDTAISSVISMTAQEWNIARTDETNFLFTIPNPCAVHMRVFLLCTGSGIGSRVGVSIARGWGSHPTGLLVV